VGIGGEGGLVEASMVGFGHRGIYLGNFEASSRFRPAEGKIVEVVGREEEGTWRFEPDLTGLAGVIHHLLHGHIPLMTKISSKGGKIVPRHTTTSGWNRAKIIYDNLLVGLLNAPKGNSTGRWPELDHLVKLLGGVVDSVDKKKMAEELTYLEGCWNADERSGVGREGEIWRARVRAEMKIGMEEKEGGRGGSGEGEGGGKERTRISLAGNNSFLNGSEADVLEAKRKELRVREREIREKEFVLEKRERKLS